MYRTTELAYSDEALVYFVVLAIFAGLTLLLWLASKVEALQGSLKRERSSWEREKELLVFDLEMARALAKEGRVYLVESADGLVDPDDWRPHTFFLSREKAEKYRQSFAPIPGALGRIREITPDDLPPLPVERSEADRPRTI